MASRGRRGRGRPPKTPLSGSRGSYLMKKPRAPNYVYSGNLGSDNASSRSSTPVSRDDGRVHSYRSRGNRESAYRGRSFIKQMVGELDDEFEDDAALSSGSEFDAREEIESDGDESLPDDESIYSEASYSTISSTPGKRRYIPRRPKTPELIDEDIPPLSLPTSSTDLIIPSDHLLRAVGIFEVLRHFRVILRLSPFRFEDFCSAIQSDEQCCLLAEIHISLLKALFREEDGNNTTFGPHDLKDSINIGNYFLDAMTWAELTRWYLDSDRALDFRQALPALENKEFPFCSIEDKLLVLQTLTDLFLATNSVREEIMNEGNIRYDDHCRSCHR